MNEKPNVLKGFVVEEYVKSGGGGVILSWRNSENFFLEGIMLKLDRNIIFSVSDSLNTIELTSEGTFDDDQWHHIKAVIGSEEIVLYVDGNVVDSERNDLGSIENNVDLIIGTEPKRRFEDFSGVIDEIKIYTTESSGDDDFDALVKRVDELSNKVDTVEGRVESVEDDVSGVEGRVSTLETFIEKFIKKWESIIGQVLGLLSNGPKNLREEMVCGYMEDNKLKSFESLKLKCTIEKNNCKCNNIRDRK